MWQVATGSIIYVHMRWRELVSQTLIRDRCDPTPHASPLPLPRPPAPAPETKKMTPAARVPATSSPIPAGLEGAGQGKVGRPGGGKGGWTVWGPGGDGGGWAREGRGRLSVTGEHGHGRALARRGGEEGAPKLRRTLAHRGEAVVGGGGEEEEEEGGAASRLATGHWWWRTSEGWRRRGVGREMVVRKGTSARYGTGCAFPKRMTRRGLTSSVDGRRASASPSLSHARSPQRK